MPITLTDDEAQMLINRIAMSDPALAMLITKSQASKANGSSDNHAERSAPYGPAIRGQPLTEADYAALAGRTETYRGTPD